MPKPNSKLTTKLLQDSLKKVCELANDCLKKMRAEEPIGEGGETNETIEGKIALGRVKQYFGITNRRSL